MYSDTHTHISTLMHTGTFTQRLVHITVEWHPSTTHSPRGKAHTPFSSAFHFGSHPTSFSFQFGK